MSSHNRDQSIESTSALRQVAEYHPGIVSACAHTLRRSLNPEYEQIQQASEVRHAVSAPAQRSPQHFFLLRLFSIRWSKVFR